MPRVLNKHRDEVGPGAVYIGRPSKWGNPFIIGRDGTRSEVIRRYDAWISSQPNLVEDVKRELKGKDLVCFCSPKPCHGDVFMRIANEAALF